MTTTRYEFTSQDLVIGDTTFEFYDDNTGGDGLGNLDGMILYSEGDPDDDEDNYRTDQVVWSQQEFANGDKVWTSSRYIVRVRGSLEGIR